MTQRALVIDLM